MPNKDGTGPEGKGPKTGRMMGNCAGTTPGGTPRGRGFGPCGFQRRRCSEKTSDDTSANKVT